MEMRRIELLSENPSAKISSITAGDLTFPRYAARRQAAHLGSFISLFLPQSFGKKVPRMVDAGYLNCERFRADEQRLGCY